MKFKPIKKIKSLLAKSAEIQLHINDESRKKNPDWFRIITLKKQRLQIKDKLQKILRHPNTNSTQPHKA